MTTEILHNLPFADYAARKAVNSSLLRCIHAKSMRHAKDIYDGNANEESDALAFGTSFHSLLLENREDFVVHPATYPTDEKKKWNWNSKECKEWAELACKHTGLSVISEDEATDLRDMVQSVRESVQIPNDGQRELSLFAEKDGLPVKARLDFLSADCLTDFKSTTDANPVEFVKQCWNKGYFMQAAWHFDIARWCGLERKEFWLVAVEKSAPYVCCVLKLRDEPCSFLRVGRRQARAALQKLKTAIETDCWPGYGEDFAENHASQWMTKELELTA